MTPTENQSYDNLILPPNHKVMFPKLYKKIDNAITEDLPIAYLFRGKAGTGKTELMRIIAKAVYRRYPQMMLNNGKISSTVDLYEDYLQVLSSNPTDKADALRKRASYFQLPFLFLDDLGVEAAKGSNAISYISNGIQRMYDAWKYKHSFYVYIITTNLRTPGTPSIQEVYDDRVEDRLIEMLTVVDFKNTSFRIAKQKIHREE